MQDEIPKPGSTISLISSAQVRYEGILEIIQMGPDESSITLANGTLSAAALKHNLKEKSSYSLQTQHFRDIMVLMAAEASTKLRCVVASFQYLS